jgi:DNA-binding NtrC family response regulator
MKPRVLLVDDDPNVLDGLRRALYQQPYEVVVAGGGMAALEVLANREVDVIVSDQDMPGMRGTDLLARVRAAHPDTMRILLTGQGTFEVALRAINDGEVFRFLTKPCNVVELAVTLRQALLQRTLIVESRRLLQMVRRQSRAMDELEDEMRGLTKVERDPAGTIVVRDTPADLGALLHEVETELRVADDRLRAREREIRRRGEQMLLQRARQGQ